MTRDGAVVELRVVGENQHTFGLSQLSLRRLHGFELCPVYQEGWHVGVRVGDLGTLSAQGGDDLEGRRLPSVPYAPLVGDAEDKDPGALEGAAQLVESFGDDGQHVCWHRSVDVVRQGDEPCLVAIETHRPGEIEGVHRNAVPADPRT